MTLRARDPLSAGGKLPAHVLNQLVAAARAGQSAASAGDLEVSAGDLGTTVSDPRPRPLWAQIDGGTNPYAWTEADENQPPTFPELNAPGWVALSGTTDQDASGNYVGLPAYEVNGRSDVPPGTKVKIWLAPSQTYYLFSLDSPCPCDALLLPSTLYVWKNRFSGLCPNSACQDCYVLTNNGQSWVGSDLLTQCTYRLYVCSSDCNYGGVHDNYVVQATGGKWCDHMLNPITIADCFSCSTGIFLATWVDICCGDVWTISNVPGGACVGSGSPPPPPPPGGYNCTGGACVGVSSDPGYPTLATCLAECAGASSWNCTGGNCVEIQGSGGTYSTLNACLTACATPWCCEPSGTGSCVQTTSCPLGDVTYATQQECLAACGQSGGISYNCVSGACVQISGTGGTYATLALCQAGCASTTTYDCIGGVCIDTGTNSGAYSSLTACQSGCGNVCPTFCPGNECIPGVLHATITAGGCAGLDSTVTLTWSGVLWAGTGPGGLVVTVAQHGSQALLTVSCPGGSFLQVLATPSSCAPLSISFSGTLPATTCSAAAGCSGSQSITVVVTT
jgi:hypothetical protein